MQDPSYYYPRTKFITIKFGTVKIFSSIVILLIFSTVTSIGYSYNVFGASDLTKGILLDRNQMTYNGFSHKIDTKIIDLIQSPIQQQSIVHKLGTSYNNGKVAIYITLNPNQTSEIPTGIEITAKEKNIVVAKMTIDEMNQTSLLPNVVSITLPDMAVPYTISEGVSFSAANKLQQQGLTGTGVKVAIIDGGFITSDPKIQGNIISAKLFDSGGVCSGNIACGNTAGSSHGTAISEIVKDMAPNASLMLYTIGNSIDFDNAIDDAIANHAKIITSSLGFPTVGGDGTTNLFRDGTSIVAKKVNQANAAGIFVTISAGNSGISHWEGTYSPSPVAPSSLGLSIWQSVMNFQPSAIGNQKACLPVYDAGYLFVAAWNAWPFTTQDYDLFLYDSSMTTPLTGSLRSQNPLNLDPIEAFLGVAHGYSCLVVASYSSTQNHFFHIDATNNLIDPAVGVRSGSISTPADAGGAFTVGAINQATDLLESFSASGPTDDNRAKPEICGPDNTSTDQSSFSRFNGTSPATPHVAGAAALLLQQTPTLTPDQLKQKLTGAARFNVAYSVANLCGSSSGALYLLGAAQTMGLSSSLGSINTSVTVAGNFFSPNSMTAIKYDGITKNTVTTNSTGGFKVTVTIPASIKGNHSISVTDSATHTISSTFTVTQSISLDSSTGSVGTPVTITGDGFAASSSTSIKYNGVTKTTVITNSTGDFKTILTIPSSNLGPNTLSATDGSNNTASAMFTVIPPPPVKNQIDVIVGSGNSSNSPCVITENCFFPNPLHVNLGTLVKWNNTDTTNHTATSGKVSDSNAGSLFDSGLIKPGSTFGFNFTNGGTYDYFDTVHPWMIGQVIVDTVPSPPTGLSGFALTSTKINLFWSPPQNSGGSHITGYILENKIVPNTSYSALPTIGNVTKYNVTGLITGKTYIFRVSAVNAVGTGNPSNEVVAITTICTPQLGNWIITSSCTLNSTSNSPVNVIVQSGAVLIIPNGLKLNIDLVHHHLLVKSGGGVLIKAGGAIN